MEIKNDHTKTQEMTPNNDPSKTYSTVLWTCSTDLRNCSTLLWTCSTDLFHTFLRNCSTLLWTWIYRTKPMCLIVGKLLHTFVDLLHTFVDLLHTFVDLPHSTTTCATEAKQANHNVISIGLRYTLLSAKCRIALYFIK